MAGLKGATQRPRSLSPGVPASRHPTVLSVPCPLTTASAATAPAPYLSYPSAFPTMLSGTALHPKLGPGVGASSLSCPPSCYWSQAPTPSTSSLSCCCALGADTRRVKNSPSACLLAQCSTDWPLQPPVFLASGWQGCPCLLPLPPNLQLVPTLT